MWSLVYDNNKPKSISEIMKRFLLTLCCACMLLSLHAQQRTVTGRVTDASDGTPLPGVFVVVKGTARGTATDTDGRYSLDVTSSDVLVFSFIGYEAQEITVGERTSIDLSMSVSIQSLQEVVVIGYGEKSRALMTESIGTVSASDITKVPVASPD